MMKKLSLILVSLSLVAVLNAQISRSTKNSKKSDSLAITEKNKTVPAGKKQMMRELNLTKIQKSKLKAIRQTGKQKKEAIDNDESLSPAQKETKLKELKREQAKNTMDILNEEQKATMKKMRKAKNEKLMDDEND